MKITEETWAEISRNLEDHHEVFYKIWQIGKPIFTEDIPTASITFNELGEFVVFGFNPVFWDKIDLYNKLFVICHECLHVILNHGIRTKDSIDRETVNALLDVVVNHLLIQNFGFEREKIYNWKELCWVDTVFKNKKVPDDQSFEYYFNLLEKVTINLNVSTVDDHSMMGKNFDKVIDKLNKELNESTKNTLKNIIDKHFEEVGQKAGQEHGELWHFVDVQQKKKQKWENIIKKWTKKTVIENNKDIEQWARTQRRLILFPNNNIFLPSEMEVDDFDYDKRKIQVFFFLDTSGSCWNLKDRFFNAANSLPENRFDIRLFCFDTKVKETSLVSKKVYGGGGTSFQILENWIQKEIKEKNVSYPDAIFVITDGFGDNINPQKPENWHWFLTYWETLFIPKKCKTYNLNDFE
jgi:hypothetical protein